MNYTSSHESTDWRGQCTSSKELVGCLSSFRDPPPPHTHFPIQKQIGPFVWLFLQLSETNKTTFTPTLHHDWSVVQRSMYFSLTICVTFHVNMLVEPHEYETLAEMCHYPHIQTTSLSSRLCDSQFFSLPSSVVVWIRYTLWFPMWLDNSVFEPLLFQDNPALKKAYSQACGRSTSMVSQSTLSKGYNPFLP